MPAPWAARVLQQVLALGAGPQGVVGVQVQAQAAPPPPRGQRVAGWLQRAAAVLRASELVKWVWRTRWAPWRPMPCFVQGSQRLAVWRVGLVEARVTVRVQPQ